MSQTLKHLLAWPTLLGLVLGSAAQLQQRQLSAAGVYVGLALAGLIFWLVSTLHFASQRRWPITLVRCACACVMVFGGTGWRACVFADSALASALEGRDIAVSGVVAAMAQPFENGVRFRFDVDAATLSNQPVRLPRKLELAWYNRATAPAAADERQDPQHS